MVSTRTYGMKRARRTRNFIIISGSTETGIDIARQTINCQPGSCGYVAKEKQVRIVSTETGETLGPNKEGELRVKSLSLACDYWKNTELYKKSFDSEGMFLLSHR